MTGETGQQSKPPGGAAGGDTASRTANGARKRIYLRVEVPEVLDTALAHYAAAVALGKAAAARSILMRVLVKRTMVPPDPLTDRQ